MIRPIKKISVVIFTDLDGTLLNRDTFKFDEIKDYIKSLVNKGIIIIPNTSKTNAELNNFAKELDLNLPFISENGSEIHGIDFINNNFPNKIILSRDKKEFIEIDEQDVMQIIRGTGLKIFSAEAFEAL